MDRRALLKLSLLGSAGVILPKVTSASNMASPAGGLYYTKSAPDRWAKKVGGHFPSVEKMLDGKIKVATGHAMDGYKHYIVKHIVLDKDNNFLAENMFDPMKDKVPVSTFDLGTYKGEIKVLSVCNKHDTWVNAIRV